MSGYASAPVAATRLCARLATGRGAGTLFAMMRCLATLLSLLIALPALAQDLRGHGGPVRGIALGGDGQRAMTASFDSTVILWSLDTGRALQVLRFHEGAVNAVAALADGRFASAGEDGRVVLWKPGEALPVVVLAGHTAPVVALATSQDGALASASWDGTARLWPLAGGPPVVLADHRGNVNGVAFLADGTVATAAYDGAIRVFARDGRLLRRGETGAPANALMVDHDGRLIVAGGDGALRILDAALGLVDRVAVSDSPLAALAVAPDGSAIAAAGFRGALALVGRERGAVRKLEGPAFPLWSMAFSRDGEVLFTGGNDRLVRRWRVATGEPVSPLVTTASEDVPTALKSHPGAAVFRACVACHTLVADGGNRAGPTLAGLYGRKIGTATGYDYSPALRTMNIVWSPETLQRLFEEGPARFTPGTKMPEQTVNRAEDRAALAEFLALAGARQGSGRTGDAKP